MVEIHLPVEDNSIALVLNKVETMKPTLRQHSNLRKEADLQNDYSGQNSQHHKKSFDKPKHNLMEGTVNVRINL